MARRLSFGAALLVVGLFLGGTLPAGAHVNGRFGHLWNKHIAPKLASQGFVSEPHVVTEEISVPHSPGGGMPGARYSAIECPTGEKVLGGGYYVTTGVQPFHVLASAPNVEDPFNPDIRPGTQWELLMLNETGNTVVVVGYAVCA